MTHPTGVSGSMLTLDSCKMSMLEPQSVHCKADDICSCGTVSRTSCPLSTCSGALVVTTDAKRTIENVARDLNAYILAKVKHCDGIGKNDYSK